MARQPKRTVRRTKRAKSITKGYFLCIWVGRSGSFSGGRDGLYQLSWNDLCAHFGGSIREGGAKLSVCHLPAAVGRSLELLGLAVKKW